MKLLRTISTRRLLAAIAGLIIAVAGGTAIAVAAAGTGPTPPPESLAQALHQAASAPAVSGISARISFTNNLINSADIQGSDPLLNGATGRLWVSDNHQLRLELQGNNGDAQIVVKNGSFWAYDPTSNTVYQGTLPAQSSSGSGKDQSNAADAIPSVAQIQTNLNQLMQHLNIVGPTPRNVAGQPAYKIRVSPKHDGGLLGDVQLAWDAAHGVPLGIAVYARGNNTPVLELKATQISFGTIDQGVFNIQPPAGAKVVKIASPASAGASGATAKAKARAKGKKTHGKLGAHTDITGAAAVQAHLPFTLAAPSSLDGLPQQSVQLLDWGGSPAALVTYGQGLGGIAVIEQSPSPSSQPQSQSQSGGNGQPGLNLPSVSIPGAGSATELPTALGTVLHFTSASGAVSYTVLGSVPATAAQDAATQLLAKTP